MKITKGFFVVITPTVVQNTGYLKGMNRVSVMVKSANDCADAVKKAIDEFYYSESEVMGATV